MNNLILTSGKDMDIIGSKAQGDKITAKVGGNLNIETLQEKETYEEDNHSTGFGVSWNVNQTKKKPTDANGNTKIETLRFFSKPTFSASWNKGNVDSHYRSAREQAGFFAGSKGFDIYVEKNTDLMGGVVASNATTPDKNHLSTGTLSFSDLKNEADYSAKSIGAAYHKYGNYKNMTEDEQNEVYNTIGLAPNISMPVKGDASSTTKSAVAAGTIDIRENKAQDISALSRNTANSLNELGKIFDKAKIEEQQELAAVFGEEAFRLAHNLKDDGSGRKIAIHFAIGGIMSAITGAGFASGAVGAGLNEALIKALDGKDPGTAQIVSGIIGVAAAKAIGGNAQAGASAAASGTKWNKYKKDPRIKEKLQEILKNEKFDDLKENERIIVVKQDENGNTISVSVDSEGNLKDLDLPPEYADAYPEIKNGAVIVRRVTLGTATDDGNTFTVSWGEKDGHISNLIPEPNQLKDRGQQTFSFEKFSFTTHKVLDFLGYIPAVGSAASIADGILYVADGNYEEAIRSVGMIIPGAKYLKAAKKLTGVLGISSFIRAKKNIPSHLSSEKSSVFDKRGTSQIPKKNSNDSDIPQSGLPSKEANKNLFPPRATDKGFDSFTALKKYLGSAGENMQWHHIVEQSQIKSSRAGFAPEQIHNVGNVIALPSGKGSIHAKISSIYSSIQPFTGGKTVRDWLSTKSFKEQFDFGKSQLEKFGTVTLDNGKWVFKPFE